MITRKDIITYHEDRVGNYIVDTERQPEKYIYSGYFRVLYSRKGGRRALDLGCGAGTFTFPLTAKYDEVYGVDITQEMLDAMQQEAKRRNIRVRAVKADVSSMPFPDNHFDFIVAVGLMECLPDQDRVLAEIRRVLAPGGIASIRWLNRAGVWGRTERVLKKIGISFSGPFSDNFAMLDNVKCLLRKSGFRIKSITGMIRLPVNIFPKQVSWVLTLLFIRTGIVQALEKRNRKESSIHRYYYAFCTKVTK